MADKTAQLSVYVETAPGLEEVAWLEIRRRFPQAQFREFLFARDERGIVVFDVAARPGELFALRTAETVYLNGAFLSDTSRGYRDLRDLREQMVRSGDFGGAVNTYSRYRRRQVNSYRLIVRTYGKHEYDRQAVRRAVIQAIEALYPQWQRAQEEPELELWANVLGSSILIGLRLPPPSASPSAPPEAVRASVAEALVILSDPQNSDRFLDPFAEDGAILAARSGYAAQKLFAGVQSDDKSFLAPGQQAQTAAPQLVRWDGGRLPLPEASVDKIATRFPAVPATQLPGRYVEWLKEIERLLQPGATAVVLTRAYEQFKDAVREAPHLEIRGGYSVTVSGEWGRIYLLQRLEVNG